MRIESAEHRLYWKILVAGLVVDLIGAALLVAVLEKPNGVNDSEFFPTVGIAWAAIQVFRFVIMFLNIARLWVARELGAFGASGEAFLITLRENKLPKPNHTRSVDSYLSEIADDEAQPGKARVTAACLYGIRQGTKSLGLCHSVFLDGAHEKALKRYVET